MDRSDVIFLISKTMANDEYGVQRKAETKRQVFCKVNNVSHSEKTENGLLGLTPTYQFSMFRYDYNGEEVVEYKGVRYAIYDATEYDDTVRLYAQREKGA